MDWANGQVVRRWREHGSCGESGGCGEDVPCNFPEHEFVSSIYFGFLKRLPFKMRERASGRKSCLLVSEVSRFN
jgi:hypothetical protein